MILQQINVGQIVIPLFRVFLTDEFISDIIFMIQDQFQGQVIKNITFTKQSKEEV